MGAVVECVATGVPAGWGAPLYAKLDAEIAAAMMGINAVKGVEIGEGMAAARLRGGAGTHGEQQGGRNEARAKEQANGLTHDRIFPLRGR